MKPLSPDVILGVEADLREAHRPPIAIREIKEALENYNAMVQPADELIQSIERELRSSQWAPQKILQVVGALSQGIEAKPLRDKVSRLEERQQELLQTIARISQTVPLESEVAEALEQRGKLLAEIGTLKARLASVAPATDDAWKDRFVALHTAWFGYPGAFTPELVKAEREKYNALVATLNETSARERELLERLLAVSNAMLDSGEKEEAAQAAQEAVEHQLTELFSYAKDSVGAVADAKESGNG